MTEKNAERALKEAYEKAKEFFGIDLPTAQLYIVKDFSIINNSSNKKKWVGAGFFRKNTVVVIDKSLLPKIGYKEEEFEGVVLHELSHIFIKEIVKKEIPIWIEEGICNYLPFPEKKPKELSEFKELVTLDGWYKKDTPFAYCAAFFHFIERRFGKESIVKFLWSLNKNSLDESLINIFGNNLEGIEQKYREYLHEKSP